MPKPLDDSIIGEYEKFLLYGAPGAGKTFISLTGPPPTYVICFGGANELKTARSIDFRNKYPELEGELFFDHTVEELGIRGHFVAATAYDQACDLIDEALRQEEAGDFQFNTLVIDSATGLRRYAMNKAMEVNYERAGAKDKTALARYRDHNIIIPGDNDYMSEMSLTMQFMEWVFNLNKNVVVVTHEHQTKKFNRETRVVVVEGIKPLFTGNHREYLPAIFDNVWRITPIPNSRGLVGEAQLVGDDKTYAKTRMGGVLGATLRDPNLRDVIAKFRAAETKLRK